MGKRISFGEFRKAMDERMVSMEELDQYLEFDDKSPVPKLAFRQDALTDSPPPDYDVDKEVYQLQKFIEKQEDKRSDILEAAPRKRVLAEGDSWFALPAFFRPPAIADWIRRNNRFRVRNLAYWGHTLDRIIADNHYPAEIGEFRPDYFMLCGGGNDLQIGLSKGIYLHRYQPGKPHQQYITDEGKAELQSIENGHRLIIDKVSRSFRSLPILLHGYDYPRPLLGEGKYIGRYMRALGFPDSEMSPVINHVIDVLNTHVEAATRGYNTARYVDCRDVTKEYTWYDDMHPHKDGFLALSLKFERLFV